MLHPCTDFSKEVKQEPLTQQALKTSRRMNRVGDGAPITCDMYWPCPSGTTPHKTAGIALLSEVSGVAVKLLLSVMHLCSYPNTLKQVLFDFEDKLSYTTCLIID